MSGGAEEEKESDHLIIKRQLRSKTCRKWHHHRVTTLRYKRRFSGGIKTCQTFLFSESEEEFDFKYVYSFCFCLIFSLWFQDLFHFWGSIKSWENRATVLSLYENKNYSQPPPSDERSSVRFSLLLGNVSTVAEKIQTHWNTTVRYRKHNIKLLSGHIK